jgi:hypothetical protein
MSIEYKVQAESRDAARVEAIRLLKETIYWDHIGERNVYVEEIQNEST